MKMKPCKKGFTLIEVVLALGVCSVALVSIMGVLSIAIGTNGDSNTDTTLAAMSRHVLNDLRAVPFDALWEATPREADNPQPPAAGVADSPPDTIYYFTQEGLPAPTPAEAIYRCVVHKTPDLKTRGANGGPYNQLHLSLAFKWPFEAQANSGTSQTLYASIARY
jgi:prepilin-type N-terminal cleavage/methylation domain-containing protein